jgi:hypothetical protein
MQSKLLNKKICVLLMLVILFSNIFTYIIMKDINYNSEVKQNKNNNKQVSFNFNAVSDFGASNLASSFFGNQPLDELTSKINNSLWDSFVRWIPKSFDDAIIAGLYVTELTDRHLSIGTVYGFYGRRHVYVYIYNTVDMQTGELVYLNDLFEVDAEFEKIILIPGIAKLESIFDSDEYDISYFEEGNHSPEILEKIKKDLKDCSEPFGEDERLFKPTFYLSGDRIYFINIFDTLKGGVYVELDNLEEKLKVDKWW